MMLFKELATLLLVICTEISAFGNVKNAKINDTLFGDPVNKALNDLPTLTIGTDFTTITAASEQYVYLSVPTGIAANLQVASLVCLQSIVYGRLYDGSQLVQAVGSTSYFEQQVLLPGCNTTDAYGAITTGANYNGNLVFVPGNYTLIFAPVTNALQTQAPSYAVRAIPAPTATTGPLSAYPITTGQPSGTYTLSAGAWGVYQLPAYSNITLVVNDPGMAFNFTWTSLSCAYATATLSTLGSLFAVSQVEPVNCTSYVDPLSYQLSGQVAGGRYALQSGAYTFGFSYQNYDAMPKTFAFAVDTGATSTATTTSTSIPTSVGNFTIINTPADRCTAIGLCAQLGLYLADIYANNRPQASSLLSSSPAWINSWNGDYYLGTCLAIYPGIEEAITMVQQTPCTDQLPVICSSQFSSNPYIVC